MAKQFEFADFVGEFPAPFYMYETIDVPGGYNDDGEWIAGSSTEEKVLKQGIVLPLSDNTLKYAPQGAYTEKEKELYVTYPIPINTRITYEDEDYTVQQFKDFSQYADVYIYIMRYRDKGGSWWI